MYNEDATALPRDDDHFWEMVEENFEFARHVLEDYPLETRQEALEHGRKPAFHVLAYRGTSEGMDQRDYYHEMGNGLLSEVRTLIDCRELSLEFVQQWGKLMFCHGILATYVFEDADDLFAERNRQKGAAASERTPQHVFLARLLLWFMDEQKQPRKQAEPTAAKAIWSFIEAGNEDRLPLGYNLDWFKPWCAKARDVITSFPR